MADANSPAVAFLRSMHESLGWKVVCIDDTPWCHFGGSTVMTIPLSAVYSVGRSQVDRVLAATRCLIARFPTSANTGLVGHQHVLRDKAYSEASLQRQFRQMLHRGEKQLIFRALTWDEVASAGPSVLDASRRRRGITKPIDAGLWGEACKKGESSAQFAVFGCFHRAALTGFAIFWKQAAGYRAIGILVHPDFFPRGAANVLLFRSARELIARQDCEHVIFGRSGIPEADGHGRLSRHAGFIEEPLHLAATLHPRLRWLGRIERSTTLISAAGRMLGARNRLSHQFEAIATVAATDPRLLPE
jgi:hypothetical protein